MSSARLLLVCVAVATAVPLPTRRHDPWTTTTAAPTTTTTAAPTTTTAPTKSSNSRSGISTRSKLIQKGFTTGGAAVSATGATQGSVSSNVNIWSPDFKVQQAAAGNSGVSGTSVSAGNGAFKQRAQADTVVDFTKDGIKVNTGTVGIGFTKGGAGVVQKAGANGGANRLVAAIIKLGNGSKVVRIAKKQKASGTSSNGHQASSSGPGHFSTVNVGGTEIKLKGPLSD